MEYQTTKCFNRGEIRRKNSRGLQYDAEMQREHLITEMIILDIKF